MKKLFCYLLVIILITTKANAHDFIADSIKSVIANTKSDSIKSSSLIALARHEYIYLQNHDTAIKVLNSALAYARQKGLTKQEVYSLLFLSGYNY